MNAFSRIAPYYNSLMAGVPYRMWVGYYRLLLGKQGIHPQNYLDLCCGTGTIAELIAKDKVPVVGVDISPQMIEVARRSAARRRLPIEYVCADVCKLKLDRRFDAAYSFFDSLNYILEPDRLREAILRAFQHLHPGGSLVFDLNTAYAFERKMFDQSDTRKGTDVRYVWSGEYDPATLLIRVKMEFDTPGGHFVEVHEQRAHPPDEVRTYLEQAGFRDIEVFDSYTLDPPRKRSDRIHFAALVP